MLLLTSILCFINNNLWKRLRQTRSQAPSQARGKTPSWARGKTLLYILISKFNKKVLYFTLQLYTTLVFLVFFSMLRCAVFLPTCSSFYKIEQGLRFYIYLALLEQMG